MRFIPLIAALCFFPGTGLGMSFSAPLPGLVGTLSSLADFKESSFDFGQQFSAIENVWIEVEARVSALEFDVCGTTFDPQPCVHEIRLLGFFARLDKEDTPEFGTVSSEALSFGDSGALEAYGVDSAAFRKRLGFDFLLDGEGSLILFWNGISVFPEVIIADVIQPSGEIFNARLIIEGTPIPEPATALLVAVGILVLTGTRRNRRSPGALR